MDWTVDDVTKIANSSYSHWTYFESPAHHVKTIAYSACKAGYPKTAHSDVLLDKCVSSTGHTLLSVNSGVISADIL